MRFIIVLIENSQCYICHDMNVFSVLILLSAKGFSRVVPYSHVTHVMSQQTQQWHVSVSICLSLEPGTSLSDNTAYNKAFE